MITLSEVGEIFNIVYPIFRRGERKQNIRKMKTKYFVLIKVAIYFAIEFHIGAVGLYMSVWKAY